MTTQELFDLAQKRYRYASSLVTDMVEFIRKEQPEFKAINSYCQFDMIVQYILLKVALADGKFLEIEGEFIDQITDTYDILQLFDKHDDQYNWSFAGALMNYEQVASLISKVEKLANEHIFAFADLFAEVDLKDRSKNYIQEIYHSIKDIASAFIMADGTSSPEEVEIAVNVVRDCLTGPWLTKQKKLKNRR